MKGASWWWGPVTLAVLLAASWTASWRTGLPRPASAEAEDSVFSSARAMALLQDIAQEAHPTGSPEHARVRGYIHDRLDELGLEPQIQRATSLVQASGVARAGTVRNIVARMDGSDPTGLVLITAHYDSRDVAVGAGDDGSGVVAILESLRAVQAGEPLRNDVVVLITDAEEVGLLGARAFVDEHPWMREVSVVLSFEMRGAGGPSIMFETADENGWIVRALREFESPVRANSVAFEIYQRLPNDTDFTPFRLAGKQGLNFAAIDRAHVYHQEYDRPENLSAASLQHQGIQALEALEFFGQADLGEVDAPNAVYFTVPLLGLVVYPESWVLAVSGLVAFLLLAALLLARRGGARWWAIALQCFVWPVVGAIAAAAGWALSRGLPRFHPEFGSLHGSALHFEGWYVVGLAQLTLVLGVVTLFVSRRWFSLPEVALGAAVLPAILALVVGFALPLAAMNVQWPVIACLLSTILLVLSSEGSKHLFRWTLTTLLAVIVVVLLVPVLEVLWLAMSLRSAAVLAVGIALLVQLSLPALDSLRQPTGWWVALLSLAFAGVSLGLGLAGSGPGADRPAPSTLVYAAEPEAGTAYWSTEPTDHPLDAEAMQWAVEKAGSEFDERADLSRFGYFIGALPVAEAPAVTAARPEVVMVSDSLIGTRRRVRLQVRSRIGAEMVQFRYGESDTVRLMAINGHAIHEPSALRWADHWGEPERAIQLELEVDPNGTIDLFVIEHLLRPEMLLGNEAFSRPPHLAPNVVWMSDRAMLRYPVEALLDAPAP